ncbi:MAG: methyl-accepting chemotaxis protein [Fusobacteriota bacterium]
MKGKKKKSQRSSMLKNLTLINSMFIILGVVILYFSIQSMMGNELQKLEESLSEDMKRSSQSMDENFNSIFKDINSMKEEELNNDLRETASSGMEVIDEKFNNLIEKGKIFSSRKEVEDVIMRDRILSGFVDEIDGRVYEEYYIGVGRFTVLEILQNIKANIMEKNIGLLLFDKNGKMQGNINTGYKSFVKQYTEDLGKETIANNEEQIKNIISSEDGLALQGSIPTTLQSDKRNGGIVYVKPMDTSFIDEIKTSLGNDIIIFNQETPYASTLKDKDNNRVMINKHPEIYSKLKSNEKETYFKDLKIKIDGKERNYKISFTGLKNKDNEVVGMVGFLVSIDKYLEFLDQTQNRKKEIIGNLETSSNNQLNKLKNKKSSLENKISMIFIIMSVVFIILMGVMFYFLLKGRIKIIKAILKIVNKVSDANLMDKVNVKNNEELGDLATGINKMIESLRNLVKTMLKSSEETVEFIEGIKMESNKNQKSMNLFVESLNGVKDNQVEQIDQIDEINNSMKEINYAAKGISKNTEEVNEYAYEVKKIVEKGEKSVNKTLITMNDIDENVETISEVEDELVEKLKSIEEFTSVINGIAEQTNLLSLNASIEAARAGDAGKGFAVVANEVKKLASKTVQASEEIERDIKGLREKANKVRNIVEEGKNKVDSGVEISNNVGKLFKDISKMVLSISDMTNSTTAATQEQSATISMILENMDEIVESTNNLVDNVKDLSSEGENRLNEISRMDDKIDEIVKDIRSQKELVSEFKIKRQGKVREI